MAWVLSRTLCRVGIHCPRRKEIWKFDGGRGAHLCCWCWRIKWWEH